MRWAGGRSEKKPKSGPPSPDDQWLLDLRAECVRALIQHLKGSLNTKRQIDTLTRRELESLTEAVTAAWIVAVSKRIKEAPESEAVSEYALLLL